MPDSRLRLIVGLGNPGETYCFTRHNAGFMVVDAIAEAFSIPLVKKSQIPGVIFGRGCIHDVAVVICKPQTYMNNSGIPARRLADYFKISSGDMMVIHDDMDLAFGRLKIKEKGGHGGHKGLKSIIESFGGGSFTRLRIGIGRSFEDHGIQKHATDHVLGRFDSNERKLLDRIVCSAREAVVTILCEGTRRGMNRFNGKGSLVPG
jgi:peptidyl-tRNA hydrolase, PTH1 family